MNLARIFSYTRQVEAERDQFKARAESLERQLEERTQYAFALTGRPSPDVVAARTKAVLAEKSELTPLPARRNLRSIRGGLVAAAIAKREPEDKPLSEMAERADEFAEKMKA